MKVILLLLILTTTTSISLAMPLAAEHETVSLGDAENAFYGDYFFEKTGDPQGGVILTYSDINIVEVTNIAYVISQHGWSVLIIQLNNLATQPSTPADKSESLDLKLTKHLQAAIQFMEFDKGLFNLVLLSSHASWDYVNQYLVAENKPSESVKGLIWLNVMKSIDVKKLPSDLFILDLDTHIVSTIAFQSRESEFKRYKMLNYIQLGLPMVGIQSRYGENKITKRIRGWLSLNLRGMEIEKSS